MDAQDVDSSVTATLTCSLTDLTHPLNVIWSSENGTITSASAGYSDNQGCLKYVVYALKDMC